MTSKNIVSVSGSRSSSKPDAKDGQVNEEGEQVSQTSGSFSSAICRVKDQLKDNRSACVKEKVESNRRNLESYTNGLFMLSDSRKVTTSTGNDGTKDMLTQRIEKALCKLNGLDTVVGDKENVNCQEEGSSSTSTIIFGSNLGGRSVVRPIKLPEVQKIPPYTTWIFLDRNQRMADDQSVLGRRRIYYDQNGSEALICSDSEDDTVEEEDDKYEFGEGDDSLLRIMIQEEGLSQAVLDSISQCLGAKSCEIKARYDFLMEQDHQKESAELGGNGSGVENLASGDIFLGKDLDAAMDSFDNLFCRRCLVFDCRLHGCSQALVFPCEKQSPWIPPEEECNMPCGIHCYRLRVAKVEETSGPNSVPDICEVKPVLSISNDIPKTCSRRKGSTGGGLRTPKALPTESGCSNEKPVTESSCGEYDVGKDGSDLKQSESSQKGKQRGKLAGSSKKNNKRTAERVLVCMRKRQKRMASNMDAIAIGVVSPVDINLRSNSKKANSKTLGTPQKKNTRTSSAKKLLRKKNSTVKEEKNAENMELQDDTKADIQGALTEKEDGESCRKDSMVVTCAKQDDSGWSAIEKGLYAKGVEIFGQNSCFIARNLLNGLKTCSEIGEYIHRNESTMQWAAGDGPNSQSDGNGKVDRSDAMGTEARTRTRFWRRRGRVRRLKYTWKSAGHPSIKKRIADSKDQPCRQYTPCDCQSMCGKQCPCLRSGTCCEKYCGCSKGCKNRFRGCHCAKSQCRSRQCPCFAADRECDPDVCRNCWVGCGDGTLGGPPQIGDNYECRNMKLLLKQQQRVLLGRSDVSGWGAFLKNPVNKNDYLGEYTGELISHREADKRGKIYDREDSSFLFNLNDQYVLDAYRKGDKLKFANHSPTPNCYAKVIMVAGDHRVGIFAKERIAAGEELFYDYRYEPDRAPAWARKPEGLNPKRDETSTSHRRAQKVA